MAVPNQYAGTRDTCPARTVQIDHPRHRKAPWWAGSGPRTMASTRPQRMLEGDLPQGATMALAVRYDYADLRDRSTGGALVYPEAVATVLGR